MSETKWTPGPYEVREAQTYRAEIVAPSPALYGALEAAAVALCRGGGPEFGPKGLDFGLMEQIGAALRAARGETEKSNG